MLYREVVDLDRLVLVTIWLNDSAVRVFNLSYKPTIRLAGYGAGDMVGKPYPYG